ncbi:hypothetical protein CYMTET_13738 [Cymbomonas tetramitiformis]|uniref:Uncharacterized protein n=1 Tax=Cymbomonas tetramitiformis TaxID=36881 RepID=A0AAE0LB38_9CHLO|nr:hypothetical protein CYMTET_13738 [Cymbomonas tetramitiformis]
MLGTCCRGDKFPQWRQKAPGDRKYPRDDKFPTLPPPVPTAHDSAGVRAARTLYEEDTKQMDAIYVMNGRHRVKADRDLALSGKENRFEAANDTDKLTNIVVILNTEFGSAGLDLASVDLDDPSKRALGKVNVLLYDTLTYIVKAASAVEFCSGH